MPTLTIKASDLDAHTFRTAARHQRVSFSTFARDAMREAASKIESTRKYKDIIKPGFVALDGPPITSEQVYAALYDD